MRLKEAGLSLVETIVGMGLLTGIGMGFMYLNNIQQKAESGIDASADLTKSMIKLRDIVGDPRACEFNFKGKSLGQNLTTLKNSEGNDILKVGDIFGGRMYELTKISIGEHSSGSYRTSIKFEYKKVGQGTRGSSTIKSFNLFSKVSGASISECVDPVDLTAESTMKKMCMDADQLKNEDCEDNFKNLVSDVKKEYCKNHPFLDYDPGTGKCKPLDANKACAGGYIKGYNSGGQLTCYPGPVQPADPTSPTTPLPPKVCTSWTAWAPLPSETCSGMNVTQTRTCLTDGSKETKDVAGTKSDMTCCKAWSSWAPEESNQCTGVAFDQTRSCLDPGSSLKDSRKVTGTKSDATCCGNWTPDLAATCKDKEVEQKNSCGETRKIAGTKECNEKECKWRRPFAWDGSRGPHGTVMCVEYFNPAANPRFDEVTIPEGEEFYMRSGYCPFLECYGSATVKCENGVPKITSEVCNQGLEP